MPAPFLFKTDINSWAPDIGGHKDYINYLVNNSFFPPQPSGWQRQQPFLYYQWCAVAFSLGKALGFQDPWFAVRVASRILYLGYMIFSILLIERFRFPLLSKLAALSIVLFWPTAYLISTRTNSDIGFIFFFMGSLFYLHRWIEKFSYKSLAAALIFASLSLLCKGTGVISIASTAIVIAYMLVKGRVPVNYLYNKKLYFPALVLIICLLGYFGRIAYFNWFHDANLLFFANIQPSEEPAYTPAYPYHFVYFNLLDFIKKPGMHWADADNNLYTFWDGLFRTLLFDDVSINGPINLMGTISIFWLFIVFFCIRQLVFCTKNWGVTTAFIPIVAALISIVVIVMIQRMQIADCRMFNGRRIYPIIVIAAVLAAAAIERQVKANHMFTAWASAFACIGFSAVSCALTIYNNFIR